MHASLAASSDAIASACAVDLVVDRIDFVFDVGLDLVDPILKCVVAIASDPLLDHLFELTGVQCFEAVEFSRARAEARFEIGRAQFFFFDRRTR